MIDIHTHILYKVDDGSKSLEESITLLNEEIEQGVKTVVLTPHLYHPRKSRYGIETLKEHFSQIKEQTKNLDINLILGAECYYGKEFLEAVKENKVFGYNGSKTILLEFSLIKEMEIDDLVYSTIISGYNVIVAHPCRYLGITIENIKALKKSKAKIQINASSIVNKDNKKARKLALEMLKLNLVDYVASDCHNVNRNVLMKKAKAIVSRKCGKDYALKIFDTNQQKLIDSVSKTEEI